MRIIRRFHHIYALAILSLFFFAAVKGISAHFCGNEWVVIEMFGELTTCDDITENTSCSSTNKSCCKDKNSNCCQFDLKIFDYQSIIKSIDQSFGDDQKGFAKHLIAPVHVAQTDFDNNRFLIHNKCNTPPAFKRFVEYQAFLC